MYTTQTNLISSLKHIAKSSDSPLQKAVAQEILDSVISDEDVANYLSDLLKHGCVSGMVSSMIYYVDTHRFYDEHYYEIEELRHNYIKSTGEQLFIQDDFKNFMAWFAFEETAYHLVQQLNIEV